MDAPALPEQRPWTPYTDDVVIPESSAVRESDKALYVIAGNGKAGWVPKSQIRRYSDCYYVGDRNQTLVVSRWWATVVRWKGAES